MPSVANINWILFDVLLKPCGLDAWYYRPFGTMNNFVAYEFRPVSRLHQEHVLFHYEQEPIIDATLGQAYYNVFPAYKKLRILANSERSQIKKKFIAEHQMEDLYFFYHGLAVLDWFRDAVFVENKQKPKVPFLCLNNLNDGNKIYRTQFCAMLWELGILDKGTVSLNLVYDRSSTLFKNQDYLTSKGKNVIAKWLRSNPALPLRADSCSVNGQMSAQFGFNDLELWQSAFIHVVNESVFYHPKLHLTEKIFKPIIAQRPFVLLGAPGNLAYLRSYGFQTFDRWIDEGYDNEPNNDKRLQLAAHEIKKICELSQSQRLDMLYEMKSVLEHNRTHLLMGEFKQLVVDELVENFDTCIRSWNNGRLDHRCPEHPNLDQAKRILMR